MPPIVLAPGDSFTWFFQLKADTNSGPTSGNGIADFFDTPTLAIVLPVGSDADDLRSLDGRDGSDFAWITTAVPAPVPALGLPALLVGSLSLVLSGIWFANRRYSMA